MVAAKSSKDYICLMSFSTRFACFRVKWISILFKIGHSVLLQKGAFYFRFSSAEMKRLYRGFKTECPTGVLTEESFHNIYTSFFPWGEEPYHGE